MASAGRSDLGAGQSQESRARGLIFAHITRRALASAASSSPPSSESASVISRSRPWTRYCSCEVGNHQQASAALLAASSAAFSERVSVVNCSAQEGSPATASGMNPRNTTVRQAGVPSGRTVASCT